MDQLHTVIGQSFFDAIEDAVVKDNGRGFQPHDIPAGHYGLIGINERVHLVGGKLDLSSSPKAGTRIEVAIPLKDRDRL